MFVCEIYYIDVIFDQKQRFSVDYQLCRGIYVRAHYITNRPGFPQDIFLSAKYIRESDKCDLF